MKNLNKKLRGFSLIELMIAMLIGLFLVGATISVYLAQTQMSQSTTSQSTIQNAENAIAALVTPIVRSAGYVGCYMPSISPPKSNLTAGGPPPLGTFNASPSMLVGYDAVGTNGNGSSYAIAQDNSANDTTASDWSPALDPTLVGNTEAGSDVLVVLGAPTDAYPIWIPTPTASSSTTMTLGPGENTPLTVGQIGIVTDCLKAIIFQITAIAGSASAGFTITHSAGGGAMANSVSGLGVNYQPGALFVPLQQTAIYVAQGQGDQSTLVTATYSGGAWNAQPLVPGVESMQVLYGIASNPAVSAVTQYVAASAVSNWSQVSAIRLGFLIQGQAGSATTACPSPTQCTVLGTTITVPNDGRLRHVYELTIDLRNFLS